MLPSIFLLIIGMISIQYGCSLAKILFPLVGPMGATTFRQGLSTLMLMALYRPWRTPLTRKQLGFIGLYGVALGGMNLFFYMAIERIPLGVGVALEFTGPLSVALACSRRLLDFIWVILAVLGILLLLPLSASSQALDSLGIVYAFVAGGFWGAYILLGQKAGSGLPAGTTTALGMLAATLVVSPFTATAMNRDWFSLTLLPLALAVALLSSAIPYSVEMIALKKLPAKTFSILMSLEPAIGALTGFLFLGEHLSFTQGIAISCIMAASIGSSIALKSAKSEPLPEACY